MLKSLKLYEDGFPVNNSLLVLERRWTLGSFLWLRAHCEQNYSRCMSCIKQYHVDIFSSLYAALHVTMQLLSL